VVEPHWKHGKQRLEFVERYKPKLYCGLRTMCFTYYLPLFTKLTSNTKNKIET